MWRANRNCGKSNRLRVLASPGYLGRGACRRGQNGLGLDVSWRDRHSASATSGTDYGARAGLSEGQAQFCGRRIILAKTGKDVAAGAALLQGQVRISWRAQKSGGRRKRVRVERGKDKDKLRQREREGEKKQRGERERDRERSGLTLASLPHQGDKSPLRLFGVPARPARCLVQPCSQEKEKARPAHQGGGARVRTRTRRQRAGPTQRGLRVQTHAAPNKKAGPLRQAKAAAPPTKRMISGAECRGPVCAKARDANKKAGPTHQGGGARASNRTHMQTAHTCKRTAGPAFKYTLRPGEGRASVPGWWGLRVQMHAPPKKAGPPHQGGAARACKRHTPPKKRQGQHTTAARAGPTQTGPTHQGGKASTCKQTRRQRKGKAKAPPKKWQGQGTNTAGPVRANARAAKEKAGPQCQAAGPARANARAAKEKAGPAKAAGPEHAGQKTTNKKQKTPWVCRQIPPPAPPSLPARDPARGDRERKREKGRERFRERQKEKRRERERGHRSPGTLLPLRPAKPIGRSFNKF